ncbi:unnamed protein product [Periconia digitata]|uniref:Uncharacterized protein n=1 Tax=Periconia digitata TaxID=1303443 RepID=A0A9W4U553_9PLEO|nr:unnamed protein product [Periconia digitata]
MACGGLVFSGASPRILPERLLFISVSWNSSPPMTLTSGNALLISDISLRFLPTSGG